MIRKLFNWIFKEHVEKLKHHIEEAEKVIASANNKFERLNELTNNLEGILSNVLENIDISVDVHENHRYSQSWAVISLQGQKSDYIKFVDLGNRDLREISEWLRQFERDSNIKIDASPQASGFLRFTR